ncbi:MAG TPA: InlB B-repeat-containing protein [Pseudoflavonifractor sp.]|nr:InlB B-repeat-containing protein [Pseudoflavonifractor sp.]
METAAIVVFDPDDGTQYQDFYKVTVYVGDTLAEPADPVRDGYFFRGWYSHLGEDNAPVLWDFENGTVEENMTLWAAWEKGCIVAFDPDDGTQYQNFYKVTVHVGETVAEPADPVRDGYFFKGWYSHLDEDDAPVLWDFEDGTVKENMTLWAAWEKGCIVAFDPDDGTQYQNFYKVTVHVGETVAEPADPVREGYLFKGWYSHLDEDDAPVLWDFENGTVEENMTLWAAWEKGYIVAFDPDDGVTQYQDFHRVTVPIGGKVTDVPADPKREGYLFKGWYSHLDEDDAPVLWDFENGTVEENMTLWAAWEKKSEGGGNPGTTNPGTTNPGTTDPGTTDPGTTGPGGDPDEGQSGENSGNGGEEEITIDDGGIPAGSGSSGGGALDKVPQTGDTSLPAIFYGVLALMSLLSLGLCLLKRKRTV